MAEQNLEEGIITGPEIRWDGTTAIIGSGDSEIIIPLNAKADYVNELGVIYRFTNSSDGLTFKIELDEFYRRRGMACIAFDFDPIHGFTTDDDLQPTVIIQDSPSPPAPASPPSPTTKE
jgi:hypothetical protein